MVLLIAFQANIGVVAADANDADNKTSITQDAKAALYPFRKNGKWGYMDAKGNVIVKPQYDNAYQFSDGLAAVRLKGKGGYIDASGKIAIPIKYDYASSFENGNAVVARYNNEMDEYTYYWIKPNGKYFLKLNEPDYYIISYKPFCDGLARVELDGDEPWFGYIDKKGSSVIHCAYHEAENFSEGLAAVRKNDKYEFINTKGEIAIKQNYSWIGSFSEGLAPVRVGGRDGKEGYIDKKGNMKIPLTYQQTRPFSDGLAAVKLNGKWGFIDKNNKFVIEPQYDNVDDCINGLIMVKSDPPVPYVGEYLYYIDKTNNKIEPKI